MTEKNSLHYNVVRGTKTNLTNLAYSQEFLQYLSEQDKLNMTDELVNF